MTHNVLIQNKVAAEDIKSFNVSAINANDALDNGNAIVLATQDTAGTYGQTEVWDATQPKTATLSGCYMVYEPEVVLTTSGTNVYKGLDPDPRDFSIAAGTVFSAFKPQLGDIITMTADGFVTGTGAASAFANAADSSYLFTWASSVGAGLSLSYIATTYISIGTGGIDTQRVTAYKMKVVNL
jgi:hypothetical protein